MKFDVYVSVPERVVVVFDVSASLRDLLGRIITIFEDRKGLAQAAAELKRSTDTLEQSVAQNKSVV